MTEEIQIRASRSVWSKSKPWLLLSRGKPNLTFKVYSHLSDDPANYDGLLMRTLVLDSVGCVIKPQFSPQIEMSPAVSRVGKGVEGREIDSNNDRLAVKPIPSFNPRRHFLQPIWICYLRRLTPPFLLCIWMLLSRLGLYINSPLRFVVYERLCEPKFIQHLIIWSSPWLFTFINPYNFPTDCI